MKKVFFACLLFLSVAVQGQSSFRKFKDSKTGAITAYSDGFTQYKIKEEFVYGQITKVAVPVFDVQPRYNGGKYYLKLFSNEITQTGDLEDIWKHCFFNSDFSRKCKILLYIKLDDERILKLVGNGVMRNAGDINTFTFAITTKDIKAISTATKISVSLETTTLDDFENFPYDFTNDNLSGFRDFCEGMNI